MREASLRQRLFMCCLLFLSISFLSTAAVDVPLLLLLLALGLLLPSAGGVLQLLLTSISPQPRFCLLPLSLLS
jgi:hypothetical protein